ncbi:T9SS type A sorting domain-containing protein [Roseivirga pacifica]|uniref:type IX secretion system anionic LPS delivery protein PorZ n=1 Tax=Roseivirga pacifica TaxID=1267423 RepID=UPI003BAF5544
MKAKKPRLKKKLKRVNRTLLFVASLLLCVSLSAQNIPVFGWKTQFSYYNIQEVTTGASQVFARTDNALYNYDLADNSINLLNKNTGLSEVGIGAIAYSEQHQMLAIGYSNGNLDLWSESSFRNIPEIKSSLNLQQKAFRKLRFKDNELWGATDFGMVRYSLEKLEFVEAYQNIGANGERLAVNDIAFTTDRVFAATEDGIIDASLADDTNRQDFNFWNRTLTGINFEHIISVDNTLFAAAANDLFRYENGTWSFHSNLTEPIQALESNQALYIITNEHIYSLEGDALITLYTAPAGETLNDISFLNNQFWLGSNELGLLRFQDLSVEHTTLIPDGPANDVLLSSSFKEHTQYWVSENSISVKTPNELWENIAVRDQSNLLISDLNDIDLGLNQLAVSSYSSGVFLQTENGFENLVDLNPNHLLITTNANAYNIPAIATDAEATLWIVQRQLGQPISFYNEAANVWGTVTIYNPRGEYANDIFVASNGDKWLSIDDSQGGGILVFNEEDNAERYLNINGGQGGLPGSLVTDIAQDQDLYIWIATDEGVCFFPNQNAILSNTSLTASVPIFENRLLLRDEHLTAIAVDPANRKWIGTLNNGIWLFSETGEELIFHFTAENSPLPTNEITSINITPSTGEVFIATPRGLITFKGDATEGTDRHENVKIYPNPVPPNFNRNIVIEGLVNNAKLKITDASGNLVREVNANGSTAIWNGRTINGDRVSSGVYLVFSTNFDGTETFVGKIVVI